VCILTLLPCTIRVRSRSTKNLIISLLDAKKRSKVNAFHSNNSECFRVLGGTSSFGQPSGDINTFLRLQRLSDDDEWRRLWEATGTAPGRLPQAPRERLQVRFPAGVTIRPNDTVTNGLVRAKKCIIFMNIRGKNEAE
jgi:hypothetical protein